MAEYDREQIYTAMRAADAAGDAEAVKALTKALQEGASREQILATAKQNNVTVNEADLDQNLASRDAGGPTNQFVQEPPSTYAQLDQSVGNTVTGLAKGVGALPTMLQDGASGINRGINAGITALGAGALDLVGADGMADRFRQTGDRIDQSFAGQQSVNQMIEAANPTPEGMGGSRFAAELAGGMMVPFGPKAAPRPNTVTAHAAAARPGVINDAAQVVNEGAKRGVRVMTTDVKPPKSGMGRYIKQTLPEKIPFAGTSGPRQAQQIEREQAVVNLVEEFGGDTGRALFDDSETIVQQVSQSLAKSRGEKLSKLTTAKNSVINGIQAPFQSAPNTVRAIGEQIRKLSGIDAEAYAPVIERLRRFGDQFTSGKSLEQIEGQRRLLGELFSDPSLASIKGDGQKAINAIYGPLRDDMGAFIKDQAGPAAFGKWSRANQELSAMAGELQSTAFKNVLKQTDTTPEAVSRILFGSADNTSDITRVVANLDPAGQKKVQGALIQRAFEKAGGTDGVSVERFLSNLKALSGKIGVAFQGEDRAALEGVRRLLESTRRAAASGANVRTGEQNLPAVMGIGATQAFGLTGGVGTLGVGGLVARLYESPVIRNRLIGLGKAPAGSAKEASTLEYIMRAARPIVADWTETMGKAANSNVAASAAAEEPTAQN